MHTRVLSGRHCIRARVSNISSILRHAKTSRDGLVPGVKGAVREPVGESEGAVVHEGVRGEDELDVPVGVAAGEEFEFEAAVFGDVFVFDEDGAFIAHVAGGGALANISHSLRIRKSIDRGGWG